MLRRQIETSAAVADVRNVVGFQQTLSSASTTTFENPYIVQSMTIRVGDK
jgi:hypothetical protein